MVVEMVEKRCFEEYVIDNPEQFLQELSLVLTKLLLFYNGGIVQIIKNKNSSAINISSFSFDLPLLMQDFDNSAFDALSIQIDEISKSVNITTKQKHGTLTIEVQNFNFNPVDAWSVKTISAKEYAQSGSVALDDIERLSEILDIILELAVDKIDVNDAQAMIKYFDIVVKTFINLASLLMTIGGFSAISDTIMRLGLAFKGVSNENITQKKIALIDYAISAFISDINEWSKAVFIDKTANDIHYMDMSIISSCQQLIILFDSENEYSNVTEDNDLELF
jgi:two-component system chemotaxis response regulator CheY